MMLSTSILIIAGTGLFASGIVVGAALMAALCLDRLNVAITRTEEVVR